MSEKDKNFTDPSGKSNVENNITNIVTSGDVWNPASLFVIKSWAILKDTFTHPFSSSTIIITQDATVIEKQAQPEEKRKDEEK